MTEARFNELIAKKLSGEATGDELQELQHHLQLYPEDHYFHDLLSGWWKREDDSTHYPQRDPEVHFNYILSQATQQASQSPDAIIQKITTTRSKRYGWYWMAAASILVALFLVLNWGSSKTQNKPVLSSKPAQKSEIVAQKGSKTKLLLPDGTKVWLNSDTRLSYESDFNDSLREVTLDGEAYFDVVKNPKRPFIVHTSGISIRVLGTAFNVKSYSSEPVIEATLVRGLIEVQRNSEPHASRILLRPNEKLTYSKPPEMLDKDHQSNSFDAENAIAHKPILPQRIEISSIPRKKADSIRIETSWVYGKLLFEGDTFSELAVKMERWFNVKIVFNDHHVTNYRFRGVFEDENIDEALQALQLTNSFVYEIKGNEVTIKRK